MTEWDAMADFLEESGHPEWAEMVRKKVGADKAIEESIAAMRRFSGDGYRRSVASSIPPRPQPLGSIAASFPIVVDSSVPSGTVMHREGDRYIPAFTIRDEGEAGG